MENMPYFAPKLRETQGKSFIDCCLNLAEPIQENNLNDKKTDKVAPKNESKKDYQSKEKCNQL